MKCATWIALREYISLEVEIKLRMANARLGNKHAAEMMEQFRLRQSTLETVIREACEDNVAPKPEKE